MKRLITAIMALLLITLMQGAKADKMEAAYNSGIYLYILSDGVCKTPGAALGGIKTYMFNRDGTVLFLRGCSQPLNKQFMTIFWENGTQQPMPYIGFQPTANLLSK